MQKVTRQRKKLQKKKIKKKEKILITKERAREHRERISRGEPPSPRPVKEGSTKRSQ